MGRECFGSMDSASSKKCVMIVAGEASGDHHGARLVLAMTKKDPSVFFFGIGGETMAKAGVRLMADLAAEAVVGVTEALFRFPLFYKALQTAKAALRGLKPDLLILIDFPGFNLHLAPLAKKLGFRCCITSAPRSGPGGGAG